MPDDHLLEATYYCTDAGLPETDKDAVYLYIQLDDCICKMTISKSICEDKKELEHLVHTKIINTRGHLCEEM